MVRISRRIDPPVFFHQKSNAGSSTSVIPSARMIAAISARVSPDSGAKMATRDARAPMSGILLSLANRIGAARITTLLPASAV